MIQSLRATRTFQTSLAWPALQVMMGTLLLALLAQVKIPLFFTPVPVSLQTFAAMGLGVCLGRTKGALSAAGYLALIVAGFPVIAGGIINQAALSGPTAGYLIGMVVQAALFGEIASRSLGFAATLLGFALASCLQLAMGTLWLGTFVGFENSFHMGMLPFLSGEGVKILAIALFCKKEIFRA